MHDPQTLAFEIKSPIKHKTKMFPEGYRNTWVNIWHVDPEKDGTDDSCGWFMRSRHGDKEVLEKIIKRFEFDWDRTWKSDSGHVYWCGYFDPSGQPYLSVSAIALNLFFIAAFEMMGGRDKAMKYVQSRVAEILIFAENPTDSLHDGFTRKFAIGCNEPYTPKAREERIRDTASCIYSWILRDTRPWYKHPRWHIHHWQIQWIFGQLIWRWIFTRCCQCGKRFGFHESPVSDWNHTKVWHQSCYPSEIKINGTKISG